MKISFNPGQTWSLANAIQLGHGLNNVRDDPDDGLLSNEIGDLANDNPVRALVLELIKRADEGVVIVVRHDSAGSHEKNEQGSDGGFFDAVARLVAGNYGRDYHAS